MIACDHPHTWLVCPASHPCTARQVERARRKAEAHIRACEAKPPALVIRPATGSVKA